MCQRQNVYKFPDRDMTLQKYCDSGGRGKDILLFLGKSQNFRHNGHRTPSPQHENRIPTQLHYIHILTVLLLVFRSEKFSVKKAKMRLPFLFSWLIQQWATKEPAI